MSLPGWCTPLPDAARMRATDAWAIETQGIPGEELMERAGAALADVVQEVAPTGLVVIVCGKGNNGGDGHVAARRLRGIGREVRVLATDEHPDAEPFGPGGPEGAAVIVDAVLGTGFSGAPRGSAAEAVAAMGAADAPVVAVDVPSGVDASTGAVAAAAVRAAVTVTFHAAKPGLWIHPGKAHAGEVRVVDIGIPSGADVPTADVGLVTDRVLDVVPRRGASSTKFTSGHVAVAGGAAGMSGAAHLACAAAMRAGAGYVTACVPRSLALVFEIRLPEAMTLALPPDGEAHGPEGAGGVLDLAERRGGALVLGCGLSRDDGAAAFARDLAARAPVPLVLDADGLNAHAGRLEELAARGAPTVLTPHAGELGRLLGVDSAEISAARLSAARDAARRAGAVVVLKGDDTLVAEPGGTVAVSEGGAPGLATAGTGDVLAGVCGALLAAGLDPFTAACAAVRAHVLAGRAAAAAHGPDGVIAGDVVAHLPAAFGR